MLVSEGVKLLEPVPNPRLEVYPWLTLCNLLLSIWWILTISVAYLLCPRIKDVPCCGDRLLMWHLCYDILVPYSHSQANAGLCTVRLSVLQFRLNLVYSNTILFQLTVLLYLKVHFYRNNNHIEHLLFCSREFPFLKEQILFPGSRWAICLKHRIIVLNRKRINIYASIMRSTSLHVMCIKNLPGGGVSQRSIFNHIVGCSHLCVMYVRKLSKGTVPLKCIYAIIPGRSHLHVMYVTKVLRGLVSWRSICAFILGSGRLSVIYVRNH